MADSDNRVIVIKLMWRVLHRHNIYTRRVEFTGFVRGVNYISIKEKILLHTLSQIIDLTLTLASAIMRPTLGKELLNVH